MDGSVELGDAIEVLSDENRILDALMTLRDAGHTEQILRGRDVVRRFDFQGRTLVPDELHLRDADAIIAAVGLITSTEGSRRP